MLHTRSSCDTATDNYDFTLSFLHVNIDLLPLEHGRSLYHCLPVSSHAVFPVIHVDALCLLSLHYSIRTYCKGELQGFMQNFLPTFCAG